MRTSYNFAFERRISVVIDTFRGKNAMVKLLFLLYIYYLFFPFFLEETDDMNLYCWFKQSSKRGRDSHGKNFVF